MYFNQGAVHYLQMNQAKHLTLISDNWTLFLRQKERIIFGGPELFQSITAAFIDQAQSNLNRNSVLTITGKFMGNRAYLVLIQAALHSEVANEQE